MASVDDLFVVCQRLRDDAVAALATTAAGPPGYVAIYPGLPAFDCCPALMITWDMINRPSTPGNAPLDQYHRNAAWINFVSFTITALRCDGRIPDGEGFPPVASIEAAARQVAQDAWALNHEITARVRDGSLFGSFPCADVKLGPVQQLQGQGAAVGCTMSIEAGVPGY